MIGRGEETWEVEGEAVVVGEPEATVQFSTVSSRCMTSLRRVVRAAMAASRIREEDSRME